MSEKMNDKEAKQLGKKNVNRNIGLERIDGFKVMGVTCQHYDVRIHFFFSIF